LLGKHPFRSLEELMLILQVLLGVALVYITVGGLTVVYDVIRDIIKDHADMPAEYFAVLTVSWPAYWRMRYRRRSW